MGDSAEEGRNPEWFVYLDIALELVVILKVELLKFTHQNLLVKPILMHAIGNLKKPEELQFIDAEHAFDAVYAKKLGIDVEN